MKSTITHKDDLLTSKIIEIIVVRNKVEKGVEYDSTKHGKGKVNQEEEESSIEVGKGKSKDPFFSQTYNKVAHQESLIKNEKSL